MIEAIGRYFDGDPNLVNIICTDDLITITSSGYLTREKSSIDFIQNGGFQWTRTDLVLIYYSPNAVGFFTRDIENQCFVPLYSGGGSGGLLPWNHVVGSSQLVEVNQGYIATSTMQTNFILPATVAMGSVVAIEGFGTGGWVVEANSGQVIRGGSDTTSSGGSVESDQSSDNIYLLCVVPNSVWKVTSAYSQGLNYI